MAANEHTSKPRSVLWQLGVFGAFLAVLVGVPAVYGASRLFTDGPSVRVLRSGDGVKQIEELADWDSLDESFMLEAGTVGTELRLGSDADAVVAYLGERGLLSDDGVRNGILDGFWRDALIEQVSSTLAMRRSTYSDGTASPFAIAVFMSRFGLTQGSAPPFEQLPLGMRPVIPTRSSARS